MTSLDIVLVLVIAGAFIVGFLWGVIRSLLMFVAWFVVFVLSALLSVPVGDYLSTQWTSYDQNWDHMAAFAILYFAGLVLSAILLWIGIKGAQGLSRYKLLDDAVGGAFMAAAAVLGIAGVIVILGSAYHGPAGATVVGPDWTRDLYQSLLDSRVGSAINDTLIPALGTLLGPLLPADIKQAMV